MENWYLHVVKRMYMITLGRITFRKIKFFEGFFSQNVVKRVYKIILRRSVLREIKIFRGNL